MSFWPSSVNGEAELHVNPGCSSEAELSALRRCVRDLAALSALPAIWTTSDFNRGLQNLADVLCAAISARFVYIRIELPRNELAELVSTTSMRAEAGDISRISALLSSALNLRTLQVAKAVRMDGELENLNLASSQVSASDGVRGVIVAASYEGAFPRDTDKLLLSTGAAQIAILIQRSRFEKAVAERSVLLDNSNRELVETKRRLDATLAAAEIGTWTWDLRANRIVADQNLARLFGVSGEQAAGSGLDVFLRRVHEADQTALRALIARSLSEGAEFSAEYRVHSADQGVRWVSARGRVEKNKDGSPIYFPGVVVDITERKNAEVELRTARDEAREANRAKDQFLAVLSHELRTPLSPILTTVASLEEDPEFPNQFRPALDMIRRNIELETQLIDDLLDVSRITSGKLRLHLQPTKVHDVLRHALETCRNEFTAKSITLEVVLDADFDLVLGDGARLQQVFWNLLRNAAKFTPCCGHVQVRSINIEPARISLEFRDNGVGIPADAIERVFLPFEQGETQVTRQFGGLGLGLAICRAVMETHGGQIRASSLGIDQGATFTVELAVVTEQALAAAETEIIASGASQIYRILLVEDHVDTARSLSFLLARSGFSVTTAHTAASALEAAAKRPFDVMVSDLGLPDMDGYALMREVSRRHALKGIALSGYGMEEDIARARDAGFEAHFVKPVNVARLRAALLRIAGSRSQG